MVAYCGEERIHVSNYVDSLHKDKIKCAEGHDLVAKRGEQKAHHFAHKHGDGTITCSKGKGEWHVDMQARVKPEFLEVRFLEDGKLHIADVCTGDKTVVEYQKSVIGPEIIREREQFYMKHASRFVWVFNCIQTDIQIELQNEDLICFRILKGSTYWMSAKSAFLDFGKRGFVEVIKSKGKKCVGRLWTFEEFDDMFLKNALREGADTRYGREKYMYKQRLEGDVIKQISARYIR